MSLSDKEKKVKELREKNEQADNEIKELERLYLEKMSKVLLMSHIVI